MIHSLCRVPERTIAPPPPFLGKNLPENPHVLLFGPGRWKVESADVIRRARLDRTDRFVVPILLVRPNPRREGVLRLDLLLAIIRCAQDMFWQRTGGSGGFISWPLP